MFVNFIIHNSKKGILMTTKALEPSAHGIQKCDTSDQPRGYCQKLFRAFREVFSVETVTERLVFWKGQARPMTKLSALISKISRLQKFSSEIMRLDADSRRSDGNFTEILI